MITLPATTKSRTIGVDVARLLLDIGEVSAKTSPVELFRLCLDAQHLLINLQEQVAAEAELVASYRNMAVDGQARLVGFARQLQRRFPYQRAALLLVKSGQAHGTEVV